MKTILQILIGVIVVCVGLYGVVISKKEVSNEAPVKEEVVFQVYKTIDKQRKGERLKFGDVKIASISESEAKSIGVNEDEVFDINSQFHYKMDLRSDQYLLRQHVTSPTDPDFVDYIISPGYVPYTIKVANQSIINGSGIYSGSVVDILVQFKRNTNREKSNIKIRPLLSKIKVLGVAYSAVDTDTDTDTDTELTLELDREQLSLLIVAMSEANIYIYRSVDSESIEPVIDNGYYELFPEFKYVNELRAGKNTIN